jgi:hypothetical protein
MQSNLETAELADAPAASAPARRPLWPIIAASAIVAGVVYYSSSGASQSDNPLLRWETFNIAKSLAAGEGYASPFGGKTGPTAWKQPALPTILAGLMWVYEGDLSDVQYTVNFLNIHILILTGVVVIAAARETCVYPSIASFVAAAVYCLWLYAQYRLCFTQAGDCWLQILAVDALIVGHTWFQPLGSKTAAAVWGVVGGLTALINPVLGGGWFVLASATAFGQRSGKPFALALLTCAVVLAPWTIRNYLVFGRFIPVKSNLWYELYQSQCETASGVLRWTTRSSTHPNSSPQARREYKEIGEIAFVDRAGQLFRKSVIEDPSRFDDRINDRFQAAMVSYEVYRPDFERRYPLMISLNKALHPLPLVAIAILAVSALARRLHPAQWIVMAVFLLYLLPSVVISYFERYGIPLIGVKALLLVWVIDGVLGAIPWRLLAGFRAESAAARRPCIAAPAPCTLP